MSIGRVIVVWLLLSTPGYAQVGGGQPAPLSEAQRVQIRISLAQLATSTKQVAVEHQQCVMAHANTSAVACAPLAAVLEQYATLRKVYCAQYPFLAGSDVCP